MTQSEADRQQRSTCGDCGERVTAPDGDALLAANLAHYLDRHPDSEKLPRVIDGTVLEVSCLDCGETFRNEATSEHGKISVQGYCSECTEKVYYRDIVHQSLSPSYAMENEVTSMESNRSNRRGAKLDARG